MTYSPPTPRYTVRSRDTLLSPLPWTDFFAQELYLDTTPSPTTSSSTTTSKTTHHIYLTPPTPHTSAPLFITHHGAGSSGLSFAALTSSLKKILPDAGVLSLDARGHGETSIQQHHHPHESQSGDDHALDLSLQTLSDDLVNVILATQAKMGWEELPGLILVGHGLGGAVVTDVARGGRLGDRVLGYAVLDVVEGMCVYLSAFCSFLDFHRRSQAKKLSISILSAGKDQYKSMKCEMRRVSLYTE